MRPTSDEAWPKACQIADDEGIDDGEGPDFRGREDPAADGEHQGDGEEQRPLRIPHGVSQRLDRGSRGIGDDERHDPDAAEAAMRAHLSEILTSLPRLAQAHPELFSD